MRKSILIIVLAIICNSVMAEWTKWILIQDWNGSPDTALYVSSAASQKTGNIVKMWHLFDYKFAQPAGGAKYLSEAAQNEYHCKKKKTRAFISYAFDGNMGYGKIVVSQKNGKIVFQNKELIDHSYKNWGSFQQGSTDELLWKIACGESVL